MNDMMCRIINTRYHQGILEPTATAGLVLVMHTVAAASTPALVWRHTSNLIILRIILQYYYVLPTTVRVIPLRTSRGICLSVYLVFLLKY